MKHLTVGVLGHVDHGKTSLVKALTGTDTDRLKEEKERGISIVLGFADLMLPSGRVAFVDVPGHERFVRTMVSGATGIGGVLLAVSAVEGIKPQTIEHLDIAALLGVRRGIIALTQCDRASPAERAARRDELRAYLAATPLCEAPMLETSAQTGEGLDALRAALDALVQDTVEIEDEGFAYLPVDRVFTMPGAGVVVTGTLRRGSLSEGDELQVHPGGARAMVRQVQSHGERVGRGLPGRRTAVNLRGMDRMAIKRGDALAPAGTLRVAHFLDLEISLLASAAQPLRDRERLRVLFGTSEVLGRFYSFDHQDLVPGQQSFGRIHLEAPAAVLVRERVILRSYSPVRTIGGGRVLDAHQARPRRAPEEDLRILETLSGGVLGDVLQLRCELAEPAPLDLEKFALAEGFATARVREAAQTLGLAPIGNAVLRKSTLEEAERAMLAALDESRRRDNLALGWPADELAGRLAIRVDPAVAARALANLAERGEVVRADGKYSLAAIEPGDGLGAVERATCDEIEAAFRAAALEPPALPDVVRDDDKRFRAYKRLVASGALIALHAANKPRSFENTIVFHRDAIARAQRELSARFAPAGRFETAQAKAALGISRKYLIPLLEHLDAQGFSRRSGEARLLLNRPV